MTYRFFKLVTVSSVSASLVCLGLAGCATGQEPVIVESHSIAESFPALTNEQIDDVLAQTTQVIEAGDKDKNPEELTPRVGDPAYSLRAGQYALAKASDSFSVAPLPTQRGTVTLTASQDWPRYVINIASHDENSPTYVEVFQQSGARDQFKLSHWVRLFPKETLPPTAVTKKGAAIIAPDADGYRAKPVDVVTNYAASVMDTAKLEEAGFDEDALAAALQKDTKDYQDALSSHYDYSHSLKEKGDVISVALEDGGVLTFATFDEHMSAERKNENARMKLKGEIGALIGDDGSANNGFSADGVVIAAFVIPAKDSEAKIQVIGAERLFTSVKAE